MGKDSERECADSWEDISHHAGTCWWGIRTSCWHFISSFFPLFFFFYFSFFHFFISSFFIFSLLHFFHFFFQAKFVATSSRMRHTSSPTKRNSRAQNTTDSTRGRWRQRNCLQVPIRCTHSRRVRTLFFLYFDFMLIFVNIICQYYLSVLFVIIIYYLFSSIWIVLSVLFFYCRFCFLFFIS